MENKNTTLFLCEYEIRSCYCLTRKGDKNIITQSIKVRFQKIKLCKEKPADTFPQPPRRKVSYFPLEIANVLIVF